MVVELSMVADVVVGGVNSSVLWIRRKGRIRLRICVFGFTVTCFLHADDCNGLWEMRNIHLYHHIYIYAFICCLSICCCEMIVSLSLLLLMFWIVWIGPYTCNGVPLRRVNQKYVIATSTSVPLNGVDVSKIDDDFFARENNEPDANDRTSTYTSAARKAAQTAVDSKLEANISKVDMLKSYLSAKFSLSRADRPHAMKF